MKNSILIVGAGKGLSLHLQKFLFKWIQNWSSCKKHQ